MKIKGIIIEDFVNYKKPCMTIEMPYCDFKCNKECGKEVCHNYSMKDDKIINISAKTLVEKYYKHNPITKAICLQGLEPFDSFDDIIELLNAIMDYNINDDIIIYTGYYPEEIKDKLAKIYDLGNNLIDTIDQISIKFGRYIPDRPSKYDDWLGVTLASDNQFSKHISTLAYEFHYFR